MVGYLSTGAGEGMNLKKIPAVSCMQTLSSTAMAGTIYAGFFLPALVAAAPAALNLSYTGFTW